MRSEEAGLVLWEAVLLWSGLATDPIPEPTSIDIREKGQVRSGPLVCPAGPVSPEKDLVVTVFLKSL